MNKYYSIQYKMPNGEINWTTVYSSMGEKYAKAEVLEDFGAKEILQCRPATKNEIALISENKKPMDKKRIKTILEKLNESVEKEFPILKEATFGGGSAGGFKAEGVFAKNTGAEHGAKQNPPPEEPLKEDTFFPNDGMEDTITIPLRAFDERQLHRLQDLLQAVNNEDNPEPDGQIAEAIQTVAEFINNYQ